MPRPLQGVLHQVCTHSRQRADQLHIAFLVREHPIERAKANANIEGEGSCIGRIDLHPQAPHTSLHQTLERVGEQLAREEARPVARRNDEHAGEQLPFGRNPPTRCARVPHGADDPTALFGKQEETHCTFAEDATEGRSAEGHTSRTVPVPIEEVGNSIEVRLSVEFPNSCAHPTTPWRGR